MIYRATKSSPFVTAQPLRRRDFAFFVEEGVKNRLEQETGFSACYEVTAGWTLQSGLAFAFCNQAPHH